MIASQALFEPAEEGGFVITFPDLGYGATQGEDESDGMEMAEDFMQLAIEDLIDKGETLPEARKYRGKNYRTVGMSVMAGLKAELYKEFCGSGIRKAELARRLGISKGNVDRLFDFKHSTRLEMLDAAFAALGKRLVIGVKEAE
jgi:antitoxin HicB